MEPTILGLFSDVKYIARHYNGQFPGEYVIPQLQTCTTLLIVLKVLVHLISGVLFEKFLVFNFPFFQFQTIIFSSMINISPL